MSVDWSSWILKKNNEVKEETLKKSDFAFVEDLDKGSKVDAYDHKAHKYPGNRPSMTEDQEKQHHKLFSNANQHPSYHPGETSGGEEHSDNYSTSAHHYMKTGKALKFPAPAQAGTKERKHFQLPSMQGPKSKLPK